jgi:hypothetical protein
MSLLSCNPENLDPGIINELICRPKSTPILDRIQEGEAEQDSDSEADHSYGPIGESDAQVVDVRLNNVDRQAIQERDQLPTEYQQLAEAMRQMHEEWLFDRMTGR